MKAKYTMKDWEWIDEFICPERMTQAKNILKKGITPKEFLVLTSVKVIDKYWMVLKLLEGADHSRFAAKVSKLFYPNEDIRWPSPLSHHTAVYTYVESKLRCCPRYRKLLVKLLREFVDEEIQT